MNPPLRRRGNPQHSPPPHEILTESEEEYVSPDNSSDNQEALMPDQEQDLSSEDHLEPPSAPDEPPSSPTHNSAVIPPNFREISTLASWTVSSSKPGCSIPQLRHPSPTLFWQSDGPQPHYLNIHFFKLVRIVGLRLYLDFEQDESYTPTRIILLAGSGANDLVEWSDMRLETPRGWVWADFSGVDDADDSFDEDDDDNDNEEGGNENENEPQGTPHTNMPTTPAPDMDLDALIPSAPPSPSTSSPSPSSSPDLENTAPLTTPLHPLTTPTTLPPPLTTPLPRSHPRTPFTSLTPNDAATTATPGRPRAEVKKRRMPVLRCHLVQVKILENHQNGKDTHLRGLQIFAMDGGKDGGVREVRGESVGVGGRREREREKDREKEREREREVKLGRSVWDEEVVLR